MRSPISTAYDYDGHDRLLKTRYPVPTQGALAASTTDFEQFTYDAGSNVTQRRLRDGQVIGYGYDNLSRLVTKDAPASEPDVSYSWDNLGRLTAASQPGHALGFGYDALGRNLTQASPLGTLTSSYDLAGRRTQLDYPSGFFVTYDRLVTGEMTKIRENGSGASAGELATFTYDDLGRRTLLQRANGTVSGYGYDAVSRLQILVQDIGGTAYDLTQNFTHNPASQIVSNTRSNDAYAWTGHGSGSTASVINGLNQIATQGGLPMNMTATATSARPTSRLSSTMPRTS